MTARRSFKLLVRARMARTGERYAAARAHLLAAGPQTNADDGAPVLVAPEATIVARTGLGWEAWFDRLDEAGMRDRTHREIARWLAAETDQPALAWNVQAVVKSYERARQGLAVGQHADGFTATASRTVAADAAVVAAYLDDPAHGGAIFAAADLRRRPSSLPGRLHLDHGDGPGRVHVRVDARPGGADGRPRATISVSHERLADADEAAGRKTWWRERLLAVRAALESVEGVEHLEGR